MADISSTGETGFSARYAAALYALAFEQNALDRTVDEMAALGRLIAQSPELGRLVRTPFAATNTRTILANALSAQGFSKLVTNFVNVAVTNRRLSDLPVLVSGFAAYVAAKRGEVVAYVTTAQPLADLQRSQLFARLTESGFGAVKLIETTDPEILGGMTLRIGTKLYDTSLKSRLSRLNHSLKGAA